MKDRKTVKEILYVVFIKYQLLFFLLIALDQITKLLALKFLGNDERIVLLNFNSWDLELSLTINSGVAFSFLKNAPQWVSACVSVIATGAIEYYVIFKKPEDKLFTILLIILSAGALGNGIDRWLSVFNKFTGYTGVVDFIYPTFFANFNVADIYVTLSCIAMIIYMIFGKEEGELTRKEKKELQRKYQEEMALKEKENDNNNDKFESQENNSDNTLESDDNSTSINVDNKENSDEQY